MHTNGEVVKKTELDPTFFAYLIIYTAQMAAKDKLNVEGVKAEINAFKTAKDKGVLDLRCFLRRRRNYALIDSV